MSTRSWGWFLAFGTACLLVLVVVANIELVRVAFETQPACAVHGDGNDTQASVYRPAKPAC